MYVCVRGVKLLNHFPRFAHVLQIRRKDIIVLVRGPSGKPIDKTPEKALQSLERPLTVTVYRNPYLPAKCGACLESLPATAFSNTQRARPLARRRCRKCIRAGRTILPVPPPTDDNGCNFATASVPTASIGTSQTRAKPTTTRDQVGDASGVSMMDTAVHDEFCSADVGQSAARASKSKTLKGTKSHKIHAHSAVEAKPSLAQPKGSRILKQTANALTSASQNIQDDNAAKPGDVCESMEDVHPAVTDAPSSAQKGAPNCPPHEKSETRDHDSDRHASATPLVAPGWTVAYVPRQQQWHQQPYHQHWQQPYSHPDQLYYQHAQHHGQWSNPADYSHQQHHWYWRHAQNGRHGWYFDAPTFTFRQSQADIGDQTHANSSTQKECHRKTVHQKPLSGQSSSMPHKSPATVASVATPKKVSDSRPLIPQHSTCAPSATTPGVSSPIDYSTVVNKKRRRGDASAPLAQTGLSTAQSKCQVDEVSAKRTKVSRNGLGVRRRKKEEITRLDAELEAWRGAVRKANPKAASPAKKRQEAIHAAHTTGETTTRKHGRDPIKVKAKPVAPIAQRRAGIELAPNSARESNSSCSDNEDSLSNLKRRVGDIISGAQSSCS